MDQLISVIGALLILAAYLAHQRGTLTRSHAAYHWMNLVGALVLTVVAYRAQQWGFVLLEGCGRRSACRRSFGGDGDRTDDVAVIVASCRACPAAPATIVQAVSTATVATKSRSRTTERDCNGSAVRRRIESGTSAPAR